MKIIRSPKRMQRVAAALRAEGRRIGFVPTMGYLHDGHLSLVRRSRAECDLTVMSIYVNPLQFGPQEDFARYPRDEKRDVRLAHAAGVEYLFIPQQDDMRPEGFSTAVTVAGISETMCGASRPGHFRGVATIVAKLFTIVSPHRAYFGQKDAQQVAVITRMARDLSFPVAIRVLPIVREKDGLAMSSRNAYLSPQEREDARVLYQTLCRARDLIMQGERHAAVLRRAMKRLINTIDSATIDYIAVVDSDRCMPRTIVSGKTLIALAVYIGNVRLIDNIIVNISRNARSAATRQKKKRS